MPVDKNGVTWRKSSQFGTFRGAPRPMRIALIVGPICAVLSIILGVVGVAQGHGILLLTTGCVLSVFWLVLFLPCARRSGKR